RVHCGNRQDKYQVRRTKDKRDDADPLLSWFVLCPSYFVLAERCSCLRRGGRGMLWAHLPRGMEAAPMTHLPPQPDDRSSLDEALFGGDLAQPDGVPEEIARGTLRGEHPVPPLPSPLTWQPPPEDDRPAEETRRAVRDGGTEYQLAGLCPG